MFRHAVNEVAQRNLPGAGWRFFYIRYEFPDAWDVFQNNVGNAFKRKGHHDLQEKRERHGKSGHLGGGPELHLQFNRNMFPFLN